MGDETTHIEITKEARRELRVWKARRDMTYTEAIMELVGNHQTTNGEGDA